MEPPFPRADTPSDTFGDQYVAYRCACGADVLVPISGRGVCDQCGRSISLAGVEKSRTVSCCTDIDSATSFEFVEGPDRSGQQLGHFRLISRIGSGGMGAVYRALDESLRRIVAVKVIRSSDQAGQVSEKETARLLNEAVAQARLNHPNVVTIYYVGRESEEPFFAMELLPGPTLAEVVCNGPLEFNQIIVFARQIISALAHAARLDLVHGDLKPSNLILAGDGTVKLSDFGVARIGQSTKAGISGTISHMAPELIEGGEPTIRSDMYSLGVTLYELTFGHRPFEVTGSTLREQILSRRKCEVAFPEKWPANVPRGWREVLSTLMAVDPADRYQSYDDLLKAIEQYAPVGTTAAGLFARGLALLIDSLVLFTCMLPMLTPIALASQPEILADLPGYVQQFVERFRILGLFAPIVPLAAVWAEWRGWRTPGRYLFQLRVVDMHGLKLSRRRRALRAIFRYIAVWVASLSTVAYAVGFDLGALLLAPVDEIVLIVDTLPVLFPGRRALHDLLFGSQVVLDTRHW